MHLSFVGIKTVVGSLKVQLILCETILACAPVLVWCVEKWCKMCRVLGV